MFDSFVQYQRLIIDQFRRLQSTYAFSIVNGDRSADDISRELQRKIAAVLFGHR